MRRIIFIIIFVGITFVAESQNASVEKSIYGIQIGVLGTWVHNEVRLSNQIALRSELGLDLGISDGSSYPKTAYVFAPVLTLEPRWYYNLNKRAEKEKVISENSGNFISLKTSFNPDWFVISNYDNAEVLNQLTVIPTWGIRREIDNHFIFEAGIGLGIRHYFVKTAGYYPNKNEGVINLHLRLGYRF